MNYLYRISAVSDYFLTLHTVCHGVEGVNLGLAFHKVTILATTWQFSAIISFFNTDNLYPKWSKNSEGLHSCSMPPEVKTVGGHTTLPVIKIGRSLGPGLMQYQVPHQPTVLVSDAMRIIHFLYCTTYIKMI
jgi:hypothetical protein